MIKIKVLIIVIILIILIDQKDIKQNENNNYCLQPIVVKKENSSYELVDGQQRLTTLFLIYQYIHEKIHLFTQKHSFSIHFSLFLH